MSGKSTIDQIRHYQKDIEKCPDNSERMLRCIHRLYILPITLEHLQETGVGRSVNSLRKYKGEVGDAAKALVSKWKAMVAAEESEEETPQVPAIKPQEIKVSSNSLAKNERKSDHHSSKERSKCKESSSSSNKHHKKSSNSESKSQSRDKSHEKPSDSTSSLKRSHSSSSSSSHKTEKDNKSHRNYKSHHDKKQNSESDDSSPPPEKKYKPHSHSKYHSSKKREVSSESEEEDSDASEESNPKSASDASPARNSEEESEVASDSSKSNVESDSNSSSDHRHRSKTHKSSHHSHKHSSHSKEKEKEKKKYKEENNKIKDKDKNKENHIHNKHSEKHSSKKNISSPDYKDLIKENEKKIKKEKKDEFMVPKTVQMKQVKLETNDDGSIDSGSGASFADALLGMESLDKKKNKKASSSSQKSPSKSSSKSSSSSSSSPSKSAERSSSKSKPSSSSSSLRSINELVEPPDLLTKKVKLEALDLDISSTLPEINPNYKPLPHVPEKFRQPKMMSDEDHMFSIMTTKNQRTKVFSGNKTKDSTVPTLFNMCIQLLYENIDAVEYTGGVPFQLLKPLLEKLNADQLYVLEHFNPYLTEETDDLWKFHAGKEFRNEKRQDMESWRELYVRCMDERERKLKALTANITQSMAKSTPVRQAKLAYVDSVVKPPRNVARKQAKFGTGSGSSSTKNPTKQEIVSKAIVGANTPGLIVKDTVPPPPAMARAASHHPTPALLKKKKAPLMQKALQVMKGTRYKR